MHPRSPALRVLIAGVVMTLLGCSSTQFIYNRLDLLARWRVAQYVPMTDAQRTRFETDFAEIWSWNRRTQLPRYAATLREMAARSAEPPSSSELAGWVKQAGDFWSETVDRAGPVLCTLGASLSQTQVEHLLAHVDRDIAEYDEKYVGPPASTLKSNAIRATDKSLRQWLGETTSEQQRLLREWVAARPESGRVWLDVRKQWRLELADLMTARGTPQFCGRLKQLLQNGDRVATPAQQAVFADERERWIEFLLRLGATLTDAQRKQLERRLSAQADEFQALADAPLANPELRSSLAAAESGA